MIVAAIKTAVRNLMEPNVSEANSSLGAGVDSILLEWMNEADTIVWAAADWYWKRKSYRWTLANTVIAQSSSSTTAYPTSIAGMRVGDRVYLREGSNYEEREITAITPGSPNSITLDSALTNTYSTSGYVSMLQYQIPWDVRKVLDLRVETTGKESDVAYIDYDKFKEDTVFVKTIGKPTKYMFSGVFNTVQPSTGSLTADATSSTSQIVDSALTGHENDYYKYWKAVSLTTAQEGFARVSAYTYSGKIISLDRLIASFASGSTYKLIRDLKQLRLDRIPDDVYKMVMEYWRTRSPLVNEYDEPDWGAEAEEFHDLLKYYCLAKWMRPKQQSGELDLSDFNTRLEVMKEQLFRPDDDGKIEVVLYDESWK